MGGEVTEEEVCGDKNHLMCGEAGDGFWEEKEVINLQGNTDEVQMNAGNPTLQEHKKMELRAAVMY